MICVLLGASFSFVRIFLLLFRLMFCIFISIKLALIAFTMRMLEVHMLLFENRKFTAVAKNSLEKSGNGIMLNIFAY